MKQRHVQIYLELSNGESVQSWRTNGLGQFVLRNRKADVKNPFALII